MEALMGWAGWKGIDNLTKEPLTQIPITLVPRLPYSRTSFNLNPKSIHHTPY